MTPEQVYARAAIEALRSGVPSRHAVEQLGTTQRVIKEAFEARLTAVAEDDGQSVEPLVVAAQFGEGKSHLLNYLKVLAANRGFVTSFVVVSPEMPFGNAHVVLQAIAEASEAPGRIGRALRALAADLKTGSPGYQQLRTWARESGIDERFSAILHLYEATRDEELRTAMLAHCEGDPLNMAVLRYGLKELGEAAGYALKTKRVALLAHDRIRLLAQLYRACGCNGWVVFFDEVDRFCLFPNKQRLAAWEELGWWQSAAREAGARLLPVIAVASGMTEHAIDFDAPRFRPGRAGLAANDRDQLGLAGIDLVKSPIRLFPPDTEQQEQIRYRVKSIYEAAYQVSLGDIDAGRRAASRSIRSEIRRWITLWDLQRCYPEYGGELDVIAGEVEQNTTEISDESLFESGEPDSYGAEFEGGN